MEDNLPDITIKELENILIKKCKQKKRVILAIAGPPTSGKSTIAKKIFEHFNLKQHDFSSILPMDGFHYDDTHLISAGLRDRKGAIETFDFGGFYNTLKRIRDMNEQEVAVPVFDREIEIARAGARIVSSNVSLIIVEGNYLLIDLYPWSQLRSFFDVKVFLNVPKIIVRERLINRWKHYKIPSDEINKKLEKNDLPNAELIYTRSSGADYLMVNK